MSPEQADGRLSLIDRRTDIYGLGAILFMILVGRPPHRGQSTDNSTRDTMDLLRGITEGDVPTAAEVDDSVAKPLSFIARKAMSKSRKDRYQNTKDLADDVRHWLADEPVTAYEASFGERLARWMRRNRTWTQGAAAALMLVATVSIIAAVMINSARQETETALRNERAALVLAGTERDNAEAASALAHRRFLDARRTVDESVSGLSEVLKYYPNTQTLREELLSRAAAEYEKFAKEHSNDPDIQLEVARAYIRLADIQRQLQQYDKALASYAQADACLNKSHEKGSDGTEIDFEVAQKDNKLAILFEEIGESQKAQDATDVALKTLSIKNLSGLDKLLRTLLGLQLLELNSDSGDYSVSEITRASLVVDGAAPMGPMVDFFADQYGMKGIGQIQAHLQLDNELRPPPTPEQWQTYMKAMAQMSALPIAKTLQLGDAETLMDLGGGPGSYAIAFCQTYANLRATIYDLDAALAVATENVKSSGLADRIQLKSGSATDVSFGATFDVIFVSHTIHLFDEPTTKRMLQSSFRALNPGGRLVIRDIITDDRGVEPVLGAFIGLNMWVEGDAYSFVILKKMMREIGYKAVENVPIADGEMPDVLGSLVVATKSASKS